VPNAGARRRDAAETARAGAAGPRARADIRVDGRHARGAGERSIALAAKLRLEAAI